MKINRHSIIGGGLSALIKDHTSTTATIYCDCSNRLSISKNFYENLGIGGNSNIWGGYINYSKFLFFLKDSKFKKFFKKQKIFKLKKLFTERKFNKTYYISNYYNNNIFRIKRNDFKNLLICKKVKKISINKKKVFLHIGREKILSKKVSICVGNLSLIEILFNSNLIKANDRISFNDGSCGYQLNFLKNFERNYYIPMTLKEILEKIFFGKKNSYLNTIKNTLFVQKFSKDYKIFSFTVSELLKYNSSKVRYFLTNHTTNLKINNVDINKYIKNISKKITVYNSGSINYYIPGPISQNIIFKASRD